MAVCLFDLDYEDPIVILDRQSEYFGKTVKTVRALAKVVGATSYEVIYPHFCVIGMTEDGGAPTKDSPHRIIGVHKRLLTQSRIDVLRSHPEAPELVAEALRRSGTLSEERIAEWITISDKRIVLPDEAASAFYMQIRNS